MKKKTIKIPKDFYKSLDRKIVFTLEVVLIAYKIGRITLQDAVRLTKLK